MYIRPGSKGKANNRRRDEERDAVIEHRVHECAYKYKIKLFEVDGVPRGAGRKNEEQGDGRKKQR